MIDDAGLHKYQAGPPSLSESVPPPSYSMILDWMRSCSGRAVSFDIWARGNYTRRIIDNMQRGAPPLIIPFKRIDEMRWAYRRLALLGVPVEFLYTGGVTPPQKILQLYPADGVVNEGGWGYIGALGSIAKIRGKKWFPVIGYSQLMPEVLLDFLTEEVSDAFVRGDVFVTPAELVGIDPSFSDKGMHALEDVTGGRRALDMAHGGATLMQLELPYLDAMPPSSFRKFISEHENELIRFRLAFKRLAAGVPPSDLNQVIEEVQSEVAALCLSDRFASLRKNAVKLGGTLVTISAAVAAAAAVDPKLMPPVAAAAGAAAAANVLTELWMQRIEERGKMRESPYCILFKLGLDKPAKVRKTNVVAEVRELQRIEDADPGTLSDYHWLCPPTPGLRFAAVRKE